MKRIVTVVAAAAAAFTLFTSHASAVTSEVDVATATTTSSNGPWTIRSNTWVGGHFAADGDWFELLDYEKDGYSALLKWQLRDNSGTVVRNGQVWMTAGYNESRYKNKDFTEGYSLKWRVCRAEYGSDSTYVELETCTDYAYNTA